MTLWGAGCTVMVGASAVTTDSTVNVASSLVTPLSVELDAFGSAETEFTCDS